MVVVINIKTKKIKNMNATVKQRNRSIFFVLLGLTLFFTVLFLPEFSSPYFGYEFMQSFLTNVIPIMLFVALLMAVWIPFIDRRLNGNNELDSNRVKMALLSILIVFIGTALLFWARMPDASDPDYWMKAKDEFVSAFVPCGFGVLGAQLIPTVNRLFSKSTE